MTAEQVQFITANEMHFGLVLDHGQNFQPSHDTTKKVLEIHKALTGEDAGCCPECIVEAHEAVWRAYQLTKDQPNDKLQRKETNSKGPKPDHSGQG